MSASLESQPITLQIFHHHAISSSGIVAEVDSVASFQIDNSLEIYRVRKYPVPSRIQYSRPPLQFPGTRIHR